MRKTMKAAAKRAYSSRLFVQVMLLVLLVYLFFSFIPERHSDTADKFLLFELGVGFTLAVLVMFIATIHWDARAVGTFGVMVGGAILYSASFIFVMRFISMGHLEPLRDLARAFFAVCTPFFAWGLVQYIDQNFEFVHRKKIMDDRDVEQNAREVRQDSREDDWKAARDLLNNDAHQGTVTGEPQPDR